MTTIDVREISSSPLFNNTTIKRRLSDESVSQVLEDLQSRGNLEWLDKSKKRAYIYWRSPEEWGSLIYTYVKDRGMVNTVCTLYELTEGADSVEQQFHGLESDLLIKSLKTLELQSRAEYCMIPESIIFLFYINSILTKLGHNI